MKTATVDTGYSILQLDDDLVVITDDEMSSIDIDQFEGEELEVWKTREDGFIFVYCNRLTLGYWVHPDLITLNK